MEGKYVFYCPNLERRIGEFLSQEAFKAWLYFGVELYESDVQYIEKIFLKIHKITTGIYYGVLIVNMEKYSPYLFLTFCAKTKTSPYIYLIPCEYTKTCCCVKTNYQLKMIYKTATSPLRPNLLVIMNTALIEETTRTLDKGIKPPKQFVGISANFLFWIGRNWRRKHLQKGSSRDNFFAKK